LLLTALCLLLVFMVLGAMLGYAIVAPGSQWLGKTLVRGPETDQKISLTFDDGPGEATPQILDILKKANIRATFFLCGENVERFPDLARRIADEGHEIGNHTYSHPYLFWKTPGRIVREITRAQAVIARSTGCQPRVFRPPYGVRWFGLFPILSQNHLSPVMWSVSGADWRLPAAKIGSRVIRKAKPGSIILLHDGVPLKEGGDRKATAEALGEIVRVLGERYRFVTVSEMA